MTFTSIAQSLALGAGAHGGGEASLVLPNLDDPSLPFLGMTGHSLVPMSARADGISYEDLCVQLLADAALDHQDGAAKA